MSKPTDSRPYFRLEKYQTRTSWDANGAATEHYKFRIVSIAGGDTVADNIPSADLAEAARKGMEDARK